MRSACLALMLDPQLSDTEIARRLSTPAQPVSRQITNAFRHRHRVDLQASIEAAVALALDPAITRKAERLAAKNERWFGLKAVVAERGADKSMAGVPGGKTGLVVRQYKMLGSGEYGEVREEYRVDTGLLEAANALERSAAEEMGQLPRPEVNIDNRIQVLIQSVKGVEPAELV